MSPCYPLLSVPQILPWNVKKLWEQLLLIAEQMAGSTWVVLGDFKTTSSVLQQTGGNTIMSAAIADFKDFLAGAEINDLWFVGNLFSWFIKQLKLPTCGKQTEFWSFKSVRLCFLGWKGSCSRLS